MEFQNRENSPLLHVTVRPSNTAVSRYLNRPANRCVKSNSALLILLWNLSVLLVYKMIYNVNLIIQLNQAQNGYIIVVTIVGIVLSPFPIAGLLADIKFGRYRTILYSSYNILIGMIIFLPLSLFGLNIEHGKKHTSIEFDNPLLIIGIIGLILIYANAMVFTTNAIVFGMDQLHDAPTQDLLLFIHWYVWIYYVSILVTEVAWNLTFYDPFYVDYLDSTRITGIALSASIFFISLLLLTFSLCVTHCKQRWFLIEHGRINPYKLVYRVIRFSWKHKIPVRRSAFTYCEDELPSRLDLSKRKYGGPFTTEQVEDVKVFLGIVKVLFFIGPLFMLKIASESVLPEFASHGKYVFKDHKEVRIEGKVHHIMVSNGLLSPLLVVVCIPLYLYILRPYISYHIPGMLKRIGIGLFLMILSLIFAFIMDMIVHATGDYGCMLKFDSFAYPHVHLDNGTVTPYIYQNVYFFVSQHMLSALINMLIDIAVFEFIFSQSPHSMKGLLIGTFFYIRDIYKVIAIASTAPFATWKTQPLSCGSTFYLMYIVIGLIILVVYVWVARKYKYRIRDEPSYERHYAEEYYSK